MKAHRQREKDQRRHKRIRHDSRMKEVTVFHTKEHVSKGIGQDLSIGGMHVLCTEPLIQGQRLKIAFDLPWDLGLIESEAQVQWVRKEHPNHAVGLSFLHLTPKHLRNIERYIGEVERGNKTSFIVKFLSFFKK